MKVAVVQKNHTFSEEWIKYLQNKAIDYITVNPYSNDFIEKIAKSTHFLWHFDHFDSKDTICAKTIINTLERKIKTFPNANECSFFDDKLEQKYLFEQHLIKHPKTFVYFNKEEAFNNMDYINFPIVAKLRKGAGSNNVWLIKNKSELKTFIAKSFKKGHSVFNTKAYLKRRYLQSKKNNDRIKGAFKSVTGAYSNNKNAHLIPKEKGYVLLQEFIENDGFDIRVVVINYAKAFTARRDANKGDWTASGSGRASYPDENIDKQYIKQAFEIAEKLNNRCIAIDFVKNHKTNEIYAIEASVFYAYYSMKRAKGYWTKELNWKKNDKDPQYFLIDTFLNQ